MAESRRARRFLKLASMGASVAAEAAANRMAGLFKDDERTESDREASSTRSGERIAATLGELKGAAMKLGQMASMAGDFLPKQLADALSVLQADAPPMDYEVIRYQIERELGDPPELLFEHFEKVPFAAASIGQVHRARTDDGREVVCKVQYPGVDKSVDADLGQLKFALRAAGLMKMPRKARNELFEEIRDRLKEELDYTNEAENVRLFQELHADDDHIIIPDVIAERSSGRVLTLAYEPGDALADLVGDERYPQELRDLLGERIYRMIYRQYFEFGIVHADPNTANFAARPNGDLVVYDFGAVKRFPDEVVSSHRKLLVAALERDPQAMEEMLCALDLRTPGTPPVPEIYPFLERFVHVVRDQGDLDHATSTMHELWMDMAKETFKHPGRFQPSRHLTAFDRAHTGQYTNVRIIQAVVPVFAICNEYAQVLPVGEAGGVSRPAPENG